MRPSKRIFRIYTDESWNPDLQLQLISHTERPQPTRSQRTWCHACKWHTSEDRCAQNRCRGEVAAQHTQACNDTAAVSKKGVRLVSLTIKVVSINCCRYPYYSKLISKYEKLAVQAKTDCPHPLFRVYSFCAMPGISISNLDKFIITCRSKKFPFSMKFNILTAIIISKMMKSRNPHITKRAPANFMCKF